MSKRAFYAAMGIVGIVAGLVRPAEANVFDDAVFWFRGGKDRVTVNGQLETGEFFDDLHANAPTHTNHTLAVYGYPENRTFRTEPVVFPAFGTSVTQDMLPSSGSSITYTAQWTTSAQTYTVNFSAPVDQELTIRISASVADNRAAADRGAGSRLRVPCDGRFVKLRAAKICDDITACAKAVIPVCSKLNIR